MIKNKLIKRPRLLLANINQNIDHNNKNRESIATGKIESLKFIKLISRLGGKKNTK